MSVKTLTPEEIECLLFRPTKLHPLDILGYGYTSEGARRFRAEKPDFLPQIFAYIQKVLEDHKIFPPETVSNNPGYRAFIYADGTSFRVSYVEEVSLSRLDRFSSKPLSVAEAARPYVKIVTNPDYL